MPTMSISLSRASGVPFYRQVEDQVAALVRCGKLRAGDPLPSVRQLAADLAVSVITVKTAYEDLEHAGLVVSHQGRGTFVTPEARAASRAELARGLRAEVRTSVARARRAGLGRKEIADAVQGAVQDAFNREE